MLPRRARGSRSHRRPAVRLRGRGSRLPQLAARDNALLRLARTRSLGVFECDSSTGAFLDRRGRSVKAAEPNRLLPREFVATAGAARELVTNQLAAAVGRNRWTAYPTRATTAAIGRGPS